MEDLLVVLNALSWNGKMYKDYSQAYLDIMDSKSEYEKLRRFVAPELHL